MSTIRTLAAETTDLLKKTLLSIDIPQQWHEVGHVLSVGDGICLASGLEGAQINEVVLLGHTTKGVVLNLEEHVVGIVILGQDHQVKEWDVVRRTHKMLSVPVGMGLLGRVIDALGRPKDMKGDLKDVTYDMMEKPAPSIMQRQPIFEPLQTGIKIIDAMIPIGRGQRELIVGDRQTGKTAIALDIILNQKRLNDTASPSEKVYCIYVAIGQKRSSLVRLVKTLEEAGAMAHCIIMDATASEVAALQFMAPYAACTIGEYFRDRGQHALVVYDDLSKHAVAYREMSLLLRRPPGREAYPGDVFYAHSRLLERAAQLNSEQQGGSLTALPIVETQAGDLSAYIPTNDISITDGQIFLESELFFKGMRPAINMGLSVSRVGSAAQTKAMRQVAGSLKLDLAQFREVEAFAQFGVELDASLSKFIAKGRCLVELMKQHEFEHLSLSQQVIAIHSGMSGLLDTLPLNRLSEFQKEFYLFLKQKHGKILEEIETSKQFTQEIKTKITELLEAFLDIFA